MIVYTWIISGAYEPPEAPDHIHVYIDMIDIIFVYYCAVDLHNYTNFYSNASTLLAMTYVYTCMYNHTNCAMMC